MIQEPPDALDYSDRWLRYDDEFSDDEVVSGDEGEVIIYYCQLLCTYIQL
jgi:hypothetical protein